MIVGYLLFGAFVGSLASVIGLLLGASFWFAFGLYVVAGSAGMILLPVALMVTGILVDRAKVTTVSDRRNEAGSPRSAEASITQQGAVIETSMRILAVDDDPFILEIIQTIAAKAGFSEVTTAASGEQALELLASSEMIFNCLLFDISMPGMDGIELCRHVRQIPRYRQTPIIMLTAMRDITNMGDAYRAGANDYATKPFDIEELGTRLQLAQETIYAQREMDSGKQASTGYHWRRERSQGFELPDGLVLQSQGSLVDHTALLNYLTQLPRKEVTDIKVLAVIIDGIEAVHTRSSSQQFALLLQDVAAAAANCFAADRVLMAYTSNATLLIATDTANALSAINIEIDIENRLQDNGSEYGTGEGTGIGVSVGGPVQAQGPKANRARMTEDLVIALAENRSLDKQGRQIAGLFRR